MFTMFVLWLAFHVLTKQNKELMFYYLANLIIDKKGFKTARKDFVITKNVFFFITKEKRYTRRIIVCYDLLFIKQTQNHKK